MDITNDKYKTQVIRMLKWLFEYNNKHKILQRTHISSAPVNFNTLNKIIRICIPELDDEYKIK